MRSEISMATFAGGAKSAPQRILESQVDVQHVDRNHDKQTFPPIASFTGCSANHVRLMCKTTLSWKD